jgi:hypothetical protein
MALGRLARVVSKELLLTSSVQPRADSISSTNAFISFYVSELVPVGCSILTAGVNYRIVVTDYLSRGERMTHHHYNMMERHIWNYISVDLKRHEGKRRPARVFGGSILLTSGVSSRIEVPRLAVQLPTASS